MHKKIASIMMASIICLNLTGCGNKENIDVSAGEKITLSFSWWGNDGRNERTMKAVEKFEEKYPNIKVKIKFAEWTGFQKKMAIYISGNTEPDLMQINYSWMEDYSKDGTGFYDLDQLSKQINPAEFSETVLEYGRQKGILNGVPSSLNGKILFYNKTLFDEVGAKIPETWEELFEAGEKFKNTGKYVLAMDGANIWTLCKAYVEQKTGHKFLTENHEIGFTEEDFKEMYRFYKELLAKQVVSTDFSPDPIKNGEAAGTLEWYTKNANIESSIEKAGGETVQGTQLVLAGAKNSGWDIKPAMLFGISKNTEHPEEAALLLNFLLCDEEAVEVLESERGLPVTVSGNQILEAKGSIDEKQKSGQEKLEAVNPSLMSPYYENTAMTTIYSDALKQILYGGAAEESWARETRKTFIKTLELLKNK